MLAYPMFAPADIHMTGDLAALATRTVPLWWRSSESGTRATMLPSIMTRVRFVRDHRLGEAVGVFLEFLRF